MHIFESTSELREQVSIWKMQGLKVGLVPTMGNLHAGHLSLVSLLQAQCDKVVVSIFVNPTQFGPGEDFDRYPRTFQTDQQQLSSINTDAIFVPSVEQMYPFGILQTVVSVPHRLTSLLEGERRPGHFDGVSTVVMKLFNMVQPDLAVFGQKDYQQLRVIQTMVDELAIPVSIVMAPISRTEKGLALSSRNQYLSAEQHAVAPKLNAALLDIAAALRSGNRDFKALTKVATQRLLLEGFDAVDYLQICDPQTLLDSTSNQSKFIILAVASLGRTRLLDNILLN
ncbi:pantoate--beta-alanine ligase [Thiomicrorhabdus arctica]|uniref:pantoate--beta-alanine ligase n=1 Tax=Thiomicrorhabdus arctica TaxID=131540 RepID=UPI0003790FE4|nr:pantoate--beta-alanine ligase [Thiomicrorhabdus arctica]